MTAVTTTAGASPSRVRRGGRRRRRAMAGTRLGEGVDPNPRFVSEKLVDESAMFMGMTRRTCTTASAADQGPRRRVRGAQPGEGREGLRERPDPAGPGTDAVRRTSPRPARPLGPGEPPTSRCAGTTLEQLAALKTPFPRTAGSPRATRPASTTAPPPPCSPPRSGPGAWPAGQDAPRVVRLRRRRARGDGHRPDPGDREGARQGGPVHRRQSACSKVNRPSRPGAVPAGPLPHADDDPRVNQYAVPSPTATLASSACA